MPKELSKEKQLEMKREAIVQRVLAEITDIQLYKADNDAFDLADELREIVVNWGNK